MYLTENKYIQLFFGLQKDVSLTHENVEEEGGLFRPNVYRGILAEGETVSELTHRSLKRVNLILEAIRTHIVIEEIGVLLRVCLAAMEIKNLIKCVNISVVDCRRGSQGRCRSAYG